MQTSIVYQIVAKGERIAGGCGRYQSKKVYVKQPTQTDIHEFVEKCTKSRCHELDLEPNSLEISIIELQVCS